MDSTHIASLDIPELSKAASIAHVFPGMENHYLLSVGQFCNEGYYVIFSIDAVTIYSSAGKSIFKEKEILIQDSGASTCGMKNHSTPFLWPITFMNYVTQEP
jgi:hypothetical protein